MDRILKLIYDNRIFVKKNYGSGLFIEQQEIVFNGVHPAVISYIKKFNNDIYENKKSIPVLCDEIQSFNEDSSWSCFFRHGNFIGYYQTHFKWENIIRINEIIDDDAIYLYPIEMASTLNDLYLDHQLTIEDKTYNYHFIDTLDPIILNHLRTGKVKLLLNIIHDPIDNPSPLIKIENYLSWHGIDPSNCIVISGNNYQDYYKEHPNAKIKMTSGFIVLGQPSVDMSNYPREGSLGYICDMVRESDLDNTKIRPKKFLCFNRNMRPHRNVLAYLAVKYKLLETSIFSFVVPTGGDNADYTSIRGDVLRLLDDSSNEDLCQQVFNLLPLEIDTHHLPKNRKNGFTSNNNNKQFYLDTYFHITSETSFVGDSKHPFFSEKTFHPIVNLQPFIFVGNPYSLKQLQDFGFKTFHPYIDETYDQLEDPKERFKLIEKEIEKLSLLTHQELHDLYYKLTDITIHNHNLLRTFINYYPFETALADIKKFYTT